MSYKEWIEAYEKEQNGHLLGRCKSATEEMVKAFPELKIIPGHVYTTWGKRGHFWCVDPDGNIVDPTVHQFQAVFEYEPFTPGCEVYVGKCMECGTEIWEAVDSLEEEPAQKSSCSTRCEQALLNYYNNL